jgi:hypothetical protein
MTYPRTLGGCAVFSGFLPFDSSSFAARVTDDAKKVVLNFYLRVITAEKLLPQPSLLNLLLAPRYLVNLQSGNTLFIRSAVSDR